MDENCRVEPVWKNPSQDELEEEAIALFHVWGMGCPNCSARVRNSLVSLNGVVEALVHHTTAAAQVIYNPKMVTVDDLITTVVSAGGDGRHEYGAQLIVPQ